MRTIADALAAVDQSLLAPVSSVDPESFPPPMELPGEPSTLRREFRRITEQIHQRYRPAPMADAEEAFQEAFARLLEQHRDDLAEPPEKWLGLLHTTARYRMANLRLDRPVSLDELAETKGDAAFKGARPCVPVTAAEGERPRVRRKGKEPWAEDTVVSAFKDFRDATGHPPRYKHLSSKFGLPSGEALEKVFGKGALNKAIIASGMTPGRTRRSTWTAEEAARECQSFRNRTGHWPTNTDYKMSRYRGGNLPGGETMMRLFGGTTEHAVQAACERILAEIDEQVECADVAILHLERESGEQLRDAA